MYYDFIEIGTSDFDTEIQRAGDRRGLSVEPIPLYLDRLPNPPSVTKANLAVSNYNGQTSVYYVLPGDINKYRLPSWIRGCNSIGQPHPTVKNYIGQLPIIQESKVEVVDFATLCQRYQVEGIDLLKIDTEGHDCTILESYITYLKTQDPTFLAKKIIFESNILTPADRITETINQLKDLGYQLVYRNENTFLRLTN